MKDFDFYTTNEKYLALKEKLKKIDIDLAIEALDVISEAIESILDYVRHPKKEEQNLLDKFKVM